MTPMSELPATTSPFEMRTATDETVVSFMAPLSAAFGEFFSEAELAQERKTWEVDRIFGAFEGERQVGACGNYSFRMTVPGGAAVPDRRRDPGRRPPGRTRRGILRRMMDHLMADAIARAEPLAILWASEAAIYQRFGFGLGSWSGTFTLPRARAAFLRPAPRVGRVRVVGEEEALALFRPLYDAYIARVPGMLALSEPFWKYGVLFDTESMRAENGLKHRVVFEVDGVAEGFAIYRTKPEWDGAGAEGDGDGDPGDRRDARRAERELWSYLGSVDLFPNLKAVRAPVPHPLAFSSRSHGRSS